MNECTDYCRLEPVHASLDRLLEGHYWLHQIEQNYHDPEPLRFNIYSTIRVLGDTYEIVYAECTKESNDRKTFGELRKSLMGIPAAERVREARNILSHYGNLKLKDRLDIGNGSSTKLRNSMPAATNPEMSTIELCKAQENFWEDEDFQNAGYRTWFVEELSPNTEIVEYLSEYWLLLAQYVRDTIELLNLGRPFPNFNLNCRKNQEHNHQICVY